MQTALVDSSIDRNNIQTKQFTDQASAQFKKKLQWKLNILLAALECNVTILYMDADIVLLKDPFPYLNSIQRVHFLAQKDITVCSGFMYLYPHNKTMQMIDVARRIRNRVNGGDQGAILNVVSQMRIRHQLLRSDLFMSGEFFFSEYNYYWDKISIFVI